MEARQQIRRLRGDRKQQGHDRLVLLQHEQLLRRVAPPAVRMAQVRHELRRRLVVHPRQDAIAYEPVRSIRLDAVVDQPPDAALVNDLVEIVLLDPRAQVRPGPCEVPHLDDAVVHVRDVDGAVRCGRHVDGTEERIERLDELVVRIRVVQIREAFFFLRADPPDDAPDRLAIEIVTHEIFRQPVAAVDVVARAPGDPFERSVGHARRVQAALHVGDANRRAPGNPEVRLELVRHGEVAVDDRELKAHRHARSAALEPDLAVVVLRDAPLAPVVAGGLLDDAVRCPARAEGVVRAVHPVVERPGQKGFLPLDVREAPVAGVEELLLVRDAVAVRVGVLPHFLRVGLFRQDRVGPEGRHESREHEVVHEHGVLVVHAVVVRVDVQRDPADRVELSGHVDVEHVAAILDDEHPAVAVERDGRRLLDDRIGEHELEAVAGRKEEQLQLLLGRLRQDGGLLGEIDAAQILASAATAAPGRITLSRRALDRARRCRGRRLRCLSARRLRRRGRRLRDDGQTCRREDEGESNGGRAPGASCIRSGLHTIPFRSLRDIIQPVCRHILRRRPRSFTYSSPELTSVVHLACSGDPDEESATPSA